MLRGYPSLALAVSFALVGCGSNAKKGPLVAQGDGIAISAGDFKARLDEQSPFIRQRYNTLERKKEFLDNLVRFDLLANAAVKQGLDKDPDVQQTLRKVMVQKLVQKTFADGADASKEIPEADQRKFYDDHRDDYVKPRKVRLLQVFFAAPPGAPERAVKAGKARQLLARLKAEEKKNPAAFAAAARESSEDQGTKSLGGDLGFKSQDELAKLYGTAFADAALAAKDGDLSLVESAQGVHVVKAAGHQDAFDRPFDQVKAQIASRLLREKRQKDFDEFVKKLREEAHVSVNDAELEKVAVAPAPQAPAGMGGFHGGMPPMMGGPPVQAPPAPPARPMAPAPRPDQK